jgi:REP element-mobilizing transposase RayT
MRDARWFHVVFNTYGTWLPGDARGFRTRHHREHVEGDYRSPPPAGIYEERHERSRSLLRKSPIQLSRPQRAVALEAIVQKLQERRTIPVAVAVGAQHVHIVCKCPPQFVKRFIGHAKKNASFSLSDEGIPGTVWAKGCRANPVRDRSHQLNAVRYVLGHERSGAAVWRYSAPRSTAPRSE